MKGYVKTTIALAIVGLTIVAFGYYLVKHPAVVTMLGHLPPLTLLVLLAMYAVSFLAYVLITRVSLSIFHKTLGLQENVLFNAYSSLTNFFVPGQSGPAFRAIYLKKRHKLNLRHYVVAGLIYYAFYTIISVLITFAGNLPWWQTTAITLLTIAICWLFFSSYKRRSRLGDGAQLNLQNVTWIGLLTLLQVVLQVGIFAIELSSVGAHASWSQILSYTGVANLALFVSFTPGGIGIRESFLLFSTQLHHLGSNIVLAASILDRAIYLLLLGAMFVMVISLHAKDKLHVTQLGQSD